MIKKTSEYGPAVVQDLSGNSSVAVPSVAAVKAAIAAGGGSGGSSSNDPNAVHRTGAETIDGDKTFLSPLRVYIPGNYQYNTTALLFAPDSQPGSNAQMAFGVTGGDSNAVEWRFAYQGFGSSTNRCDFGFSGQASPMFSYLANGLVGFGKTAPTEKVDVAGNVKAVKFVGDGSQLTNLPLGNYAVLSDTDNVFNNGQTYNGNVLLVNNYDGNGDNTGATTQLAASADGDLEINGVTVNDRFLTASPDASGSRRVFDRVQFRQGLQAGDSAGYNAQLGVGIVGSYNTAGGTFVAMDSQSIIFSNGGTVSLSAYNKQLYLNADRTVLNGSLCIKYGTEPTAVTSAGVVWADASGVLWYKSANNSKTQLAPGTASASGPTNTDGLPEGTTNKYYTDARAQAALAGQLAAKADLTAGKVALSQLPYTAGNNISIDAAGTISTTFTGFTPAAIKTAVQAGNYADGELQGTQPAGSQNNMRFTDTYWLYIYTFAAADTDGTKLAWVRAAKQ